MKLAVITKKKKCKQTSESVFREIVRSSYGCFITLNFYFCFPLNRFYFFNLFTISCLKENSQIFYLNIIPQYIPERFLNKILS